MYFFSQIINHLLLSHGAIVNTLIVVVLFFCVILILGIRKSYILKKENERLDKMTDYLSHKSSEYNDFTEGHIYGK